MSEKPRPVREGSDTSDEGRNATAERANSADQRAREADESTNRATQRPNRAAEKANRAAQRPSEGNSEPRCYCPVGGLVDLLSRKYAMQVVCLVGAFQPVRYGEIEERFGDVSSSTLSTRLDELTQAGLLDRQQYDEIPPRVEYELTADGEELCELLEPMLEWVEARNASPASTGVASGNTP